MKMKMCHVCAMMIFLLAGPVAYASSGMEIRYPGDIVKYTPTVETAPDVPDLSNTEGFVLRVVNSTYHDPTILVAWKESNYSSVSWKYPQDLTLQTRSRVSNWEENRLDCKQMHGTPADYVSFISTRVRVGVLFRSLVSNEQLWMGDVCIYLGTEGSKERFWCFRSKKLITVDSFEGLQIFGVTNYPGLYEYSKNNRLTGFYRYTILSKYETIIQYKTILLGHNNTAFLSMDCNNEKSISVIVYHSLMHFNNYAQLTDTPISVPSNISLETKWTAEYLGPNYLQFVITESAVNRIKTGVWYDVLEPAKHEIEIHAPGTDNRFTLTNDQITITLTRTMDTSALMTCLFFNGSNSNESQYAIVEDAVHVANAKYEQPGLHPVFSMVWNQLSLEFMEILIMIARVFGLENLTITMDSYVVKTNVSGLIFHMRAFKGYVSSCTITYGDGMKSTYNKTLTDFIDSIENSVDIDEAVERDPGIEHDFIKSSVYSDPGIYHVHVSCENEINSMNYSKFIVAQDVILNFFVFPIPPHEFGQPITVVWQMDRGTNVTVEIWYNDILCNTINNTITNSQNNSYDCLVNNSMHYDPDNLVDIELKAWNLVSNISTTVTVEIFEPMVITSLVALTSTAPWGSGVPGAGPNRNKFPVENLVIFKANYTGGPATSQQWQLRRRYWVVYCVDCGSRTSNSMEADFKFELDDDICDVVLVPQNPAGETEQLVTIDLDRSFSLESMTMNSPAIVNRTEPLNIELGDIGAHTCIAVDFGDSSDILLYGDSQSCEEQYNYTSRSGLLFNPITDINTTSIKIDHVFETMGTYQVKLHGKNYVSWDSIEQEVVVVNLPCEHPNVTITGFNVTNEGNLPEHWKSEMLNLTTINGINCEVTVLTQTNWSIYKLDQNPGANLGKIDNIPRTEYEFSSPINLTSPVLILDSKSLEYGFYAVKARLEMDGIPDIFDEDTKYFHVIATPFLEPALTTGFIYTVIFREIAVLNSSATVDPDFEHLDGVTYKWFCRDIDDPVQFGPDYGSEPLLYVPGVNDTFPPAEANSTGCFGKGRGQLNVTDSILSMDSTFMLEGKNFIITLVTSKLDPVYGLRRSATEIYFQVALGLPPSLEASCLKNCQERVNPAEKLIIQSTCTANCYGQLEFTWNLFWFDNIDMPEPFHLSELNQISSEILSSMVTNPINELQMAFKPNTLVPNRKYILQLLARRPNNVTGELRHTMIMNDAPNGGRCSIFPSSGVSMVTTFNITCGNWLDPNLPITYEYAYLVSGVKSVFATRAVENPGETILLESELPIGDLDRDNVLGIYTNIKDKFGGITEQHLPVKVKPPSNEEVNLNDLDNLLSGSNNPLEADGDPQNIIAAAGVIASVLNFIDQNSTSGNMTAEEMARRRDQREKVDKLKQNIMKTLSGINVTDMNTLLSMSGTMSTLTQNPENLSPTAQEYGVQSCYVAVEGLTRLSKGESSFQDVQSAVTNLITVVGQLILGCTTLPEQGNLTISESSIDRAKRTVSMLNDLHEATLRYMVPNEGPTTSTSKLITLQSEKVSISNMGKNENAASDCSFKTPSPEVFGFGDIVKDINATISQLDSVTIKMGVFNNNPYTWDNTSKTVTSKIASLELASSKHVTTSNLTEDIGITISRDPSQFPEISSFFMKPDKPDPNFDGKSYLKYHCFNRTTRWTAMNFEVYPEDVSLNLKVYLKTGGKPDVKTGDFNLQYDLPDFSSCSIEVEENNRTQENETIVVDPFNHCALHPYSVFVSNVDFNITGEHCFAVEVKNRSLDDSDSSSDNSRRKRSFACEVGKRRVRRSCVIIPPPPPPPPTESPIKVLVADNLGFDGKYFFPNQTPNYNMSMYESSCLYWDEENQTWTGYGCRVGPLTSRTNIQCFCNHLTSFGSDLVVAPNPIDFNSVFNNFGSLQDNVAVLALISTVLGLYILGVVWGRRADKRDTLMVGPTILNNPQGTYHYLVTLYTGNRQGSGTTAKVFFKMAGDNDETLPVKLWDPKRPCFERAQENQFIVSFPQEVGNLSYVQIWHNNAGLSPSWYLSRLTVKDIQTNQQWYFVCDNWLAVESEDGKVCRVIPVANDQELTNFNQLFTARTVKGLGDGHLWFSIFSRPPNSNFTRVQRLSCCLCLLCCTMITSAMFYNMGGDGPSPFAIHIGSLVIDLKQFVIALQSSLIIVPVNVAIVQIFRNLRPKKSKGEIYSEETEHNSQSKENEETKPKGKLPHWCIYIAYALCYLASAASIFFTLLYSIQWGKEKSTEWVIAMVTAFLQSVLLLQPVKVLVLAVVFAVFVRKPNDTDEQDDTSVPLEQINSVPPPKLHRKRKIYSPPDPETLQEARVKRLNEIKMNNILKEIAAFFFFLIMLLNVAYYHRDSNTFLMTKTLFETFDEVDAYGIDLAAVSDGDSLWMWARETLVPGLYATEWYNGKKAQKGFIANMEDYLVGVPRIRLARVERDSCTIDKLFKNSIPHCYDAFSLSSEEDETFGVSWEPLSTDSARKRRDLQYTPETEEEWLDIMINTVKKEETKPQNTLPKYFSPKNPHTERQGEERSRQKRAIDPITSSVTGKNRRKKKRLLGSAKPKTYLISEQALLPNGEILSCLERWRYQSTLELRGFPYWGAISLYSGGGYAANLGYSPVEGYTVISDLHSNAWIDVQSRATFIEFTVYNANTNLFGIVSIMVEFPSSSAAFTKVQYQSARFYLHLNSAQTVSHVLVIFFMLYFLYREGKLVYKQRWAYFKGFWNWVETILVVCEFMTIVLFLARLYEVDRNLLQLRENPNDYVPFQYAAGADAALCYVLGILVFFYTIRFLRLLRFNKNFAVLGKTLARISGPISGFCVPFFFAFLAFGLFAFSVFGTELQDYSTFQMTMVTQFSMTLGDFDFEALVMTNPLLGPLYFFGFVGMNVFILMNVFLAIINDSYAEVQEEEADTKNEYEILEYITEQIQLKIKGEPKRRRKRRKVYPKPEPNDKPHYVTFRETEKKLSQKIKDDYQGNEEIYKALYDNLFVEQLKNDDSCENTSKDMPPENENQESRTPVSTVYEVPVNPQITPGMNVLKLDHCGELLDNLLNKLQHADPDEEQTFEAIGEVSDENREVICYRYLLSEL